MTDKDKKDIKLMMCEALDEIVLPDLQTLKDDVAVLKDDVAALKEDVSDLYATTTRIELKLNSVVDRQDDQGADIIKIQKVLKLKAS